MHLARTCRTVEGSSPGAVDGSGELEAGSLQRRGLVHAVGMFALAVRDLRIKILPGSCRVEHFQRCLELVGFSMSSSRLSMRREFSTLAGMPSAPDRAATPAPRRGPGTALTPGRGAVADRLGRNAKRKQYCAGPRDNPSQSRSTAHRSGTTEESHCCSAEQRQRVRAPQLP